MDSSIAGLLAGGKCGMVTGFLSGSMTGLADGGLIEGFGGGLVGLIAGGVLGAVAGAVTGGIAGWINGQKNGPEPGLILGGLAGVITGWYFGGLIAQNIMTSGYKGSTDPGQIIQNNFYTNIENNFLGRQNKGTVKISVDNPRKILQKSVFGTIAAFIAWWLFF